MTDLVEQIDEMIRKASSMEPELDTLGMYFYLDVNGVCGSGAGAFLWFENREEFLQMARYVCWMYPSYTGEYDEDLLVENGRIIDAYLQGEISLDETQAQINELMSGLVQVPWWGTLRALMNGEDQFAAEFRETFWEGYQEYLEECDDDEEKIELTSKDMPIPEAMAIEFTSFVVDYI
ncbi:MAG: hypothetical protein GYA48_12980 [Chloroflexi bacterium]|nr:hypothetical protein [Chloroflexota bacterium]